MKELLIISHPFQSVEEFQRRAGTKLGRLVHRLASKYPQLQKSCGLKPMLVTLSVAWGLSGLAKAGNFAAFEHIDETLSPPLSSWGDAMMPPWGCITVEGQPFFIAESEQGMLQFLWDDFAIFIDYEGPEAVSQTFFDFADTRQTLAYKTMGEELKETSNHDKDTRKKNTEENDYIETIETKEPIETTAAKETNEIKETSQTTQDASLSQAPQGQTDVLAELVDTVIAGGNMEDAKLMSYYIDQCCIKIEGDAQHAGILQARRLDYYIDYHNNTTNIDEHNYTTSINNINNTINKKGTTMGDTYTFNVQGDYVKGDKVMGNKYVGRCQDAEEEEHLKNALAALMDEKETDGKPLFQTQAQWFAVYRILSDCYGWKDNALSEFCRRINALGMKWQVACKLDGIKKVNQTAPFYKAFSEWEPMGNQTAYDRQVKVASRFKELMEEEEA